MKFLKNPLTTTTFDIDVIFDEEANLYVAECNALSIVTEAKTYHDLVNRVKAIAPEMIELNQLETSEQFVLNFQHKELAAI